MCGILGLINKKDTRDITPLLRSTHVINHRGPDDEGFLLWDGNTSDIRLFAGEKTSEDSIRHKKLTRLSGEYTWKVGLGHKRLSILDLSPLGHQPMIDEKTGIAISYNGEIYNYRELKKELEMIGYHFNSDCDTEVLLKAWVEWDINCLNRLNGMFAFIILDPREGGTLYAVRDRFGVKPLYYSVTDGFICFASEIKQIRELPNYSFQLNEKAAYDYLAFGMIDHTEETLDQNINQLMGGEMAIICLNNLQNNPTIKRWYHLNPKKWQGTEKAAALRFKELLTDSIRYRLRADVPLGSCLSGGLDSSAIVCLIKEILEKVNDHAGQVTVTACFENQRFDEWKYAKEVIDKTGAKATRIFPDLERLKSDLDKFIWHQDQPFVSTSQFSQWCVFDGAAKVNLKVMLDGQGSDEQLAGYGGNELSLYTGLLRHFSLIDLFREAKSYKKRKGVFPLGFIIGALQNVLPEKLVKLLPRKYQIRKIQGPSWLLMNRDNPIATYKNLRESLIRQVLRSPLPSLLRYEDRSSMAFSIESRVPFMDYRFVEFTLGLPENFVFKNGIRKVILRNALKGVIPDKIVNRHDKMGFVTPEEVWLRETDPAWFREEVNKTLKLAPLLFDESKVKSLLENQISGKEPFNFSIWRIICFGRWLNMVKKGN